MKQSKTLVIVSPYFLPDGGGLETYVANISRLLAQQFHWRVVVITSGRTESRFRSSITQDSHLTIIRLPIWVKFSNTPINPLWPLMIRAILNRIQPDLINVHAPVPFMADVACLVAGKTPVVLTYHSGTMVKGKHLVDLIIRFYEVHLLPFMLKRANSIICSSQFVKNSMMHKFSYKTKVVNPGVDIHQFYPVAHKTYGERTLLFVARYANMYRMKGLYQLIAAIAQLKNIQLRVIGEKIELNNPQVSFIGLKTGADLVHEIQNATLLVLPALKNIESFGLVLVEAMACGVPVIGSNSGGIPEVIEDGVDGLVIDSNSLSSLKTAISKIVDHPEIQKKYGEAGRRKVMNQFTWEIKAKETNEIFERLVAKI